jgi:glutathione S-transferase
MAGQLSWFIRVSNLPDRDERDYAYAIHRYRKEVARLYGVLERQLAGRSYICDLYSIADIACWTWVDQYKDHVGGLSMFPRIGEWHALITERPAVKRGMLVWMPEGNDGWSIAGNSREIGQRGRKPTAT